MQLFLHLQMTNLSGVLSAVNLVTPLKAIVCRIDIGFWVSILVRKMLNIHVALIVCENIYLFMDLPTIFLHLMSYGHGLYFHGWLFSSSD